MNPMLAFGADNSAKLPVGLQLYAVRGEFERDVPGTLKTVAGMGYKGVEFWGYGGTPNVYQNYSAKDLKKMLDDNGLKCCGIHMELKAIAEENFKRTMENNRVLGNTYLNVAMAKEKMETEKGIAELAVMLDRASAECRSHQMMVGYHAHGFDFARINGRFAWDILFSQVEPRVNMQMDVGNCLSGDGDPIAMLKKFPGRTRTIHIKEYKEKTFASDYYREVFQLCETSCGTKWYIVEMGGDAGNGFDIPKEALQALRQVGKA